MANTTPRFIYGTAWKEDETRRLTELAVRTGFRAIDTANQRKHYNEAGVGEALAELRESGVVTRDELFLQTKFTHIGGQDERLPYDPEAPVSKQVQQSFESSLEHLGVARIDSLILHGPSTRVGLADDDVEAWRAMEEIADSDRVGALGVSNVTAEQLEKFVDLAEVPVRYVQNRCRASQGWDREVREICGLHDVVYQGFSLLTANVRELDDPEVAKLAQSHDATVPQIVFRFAMQLGMAPLTGTTSREHMEEDLACDQFELNPNEMAVLMEIGS